MHTALLLAKRSVSTSLLCQKIQRITSKKPAVERGFVASAAPPAPEITFEQFLAVDIRVGTIIAVEPFPEARKPALKLSIDFGPGVGVKRSSAQITGHYAAASLVGRQVAAVVNFAPRQVGRFMSEVLILGFPDETAEVVLSRPDSPVLDGARLF